MLTTSPSMPQPRHYRERSPPVTVRSDPAGSLGMPPTGPRRLERLLTVADRNRQVGGASVPDAGHILKACRPPPASGTSREPPWFLWRLPTLESRMAR